MVNEFALPTDQKVNILLVDDLTENLIALEAILSDLGQNLIRAHSGEDALKQVLQRDFAVILLDVQMPGMDGFEAATLIREREKSRHTPIIFLTAIYNSDMNIFRGYSIGAVDYMIKPIVPEVLRSKVAVFIELFKKTEEVKHQAEILRQLEQKEHEKHLAEEKRRIEAEYYAREREKEKRAAEALARKAAELERSNAELEQFAYVASHELQEPLRKVSGYTQLLARRYRGKLDKEADEFISFAVAEVQRMRKLINDLLDYARVEKRGKEFAPVDCEILVNQVVESLSSTIEENHAEVSWQGLPAIEADGDQLQQLFHNLIGNALKFRGSEPPSIRIEASRREEDWLFTVNDNGIGFEMAYAGRIFSIFQRLHGNDEYAGTGIGLSICKKIVERHGGTIWAESRPGKGSTFYFTLPAEQSRIEIDQDARV